MENTVFHLIFLPMFSILSIFTPTKHSVKPVETNQPFWVPLYELAILEMESYCVELVLG